MKKIQVNIQKLYTAAKEREEGKIWTLKHERYKDILSRSVFYETITYMIFIGMIERIKRGQYIVIEGENENEDE